MKSVVDDEVCSVQTTEYSHWQVYIILHKFEVHIITFVYIGWVCWMQKCLLGSFETCLEVVSDFTELVDTMPGHVCYKSTQHEAPPIIACEDKTIATAALSILKVHVYVHICIPIKAVLCFPT